MIKKWNADVLVVGGGPAGLAAVATLLNTTLLDICWVDPHFQGGRLVNFPDVPSNTKMSLFVQYAESCIEDCPLIQSLKSRRQDRGCKLRQVGEMVRELSAKVKLRYVERLHCITGHCKSIKQLDTGWMATMINGTTANVGKVILATGASPRSGSQLPFQGTIVDPEQCLSSESIRSIFSNDDVVGVVGSSHTAILIIKNILEAFESTNKPRIINFFCRKLRYAEFLDDGRIKYDNTGLKGEVAEWARLNMVEGEGDASNGRIKRVQLDCRDDLRIYHEWLPKCTHLIWAIGYGRNSIPDLIDIHDDPILVVDYDSRQNLLKGASDPIPNLFGLGIAFPERVMDPSGEQELAVGLWKFMHTAKLLVRGLGGELIGKD